MPITRDDNPTGLREVSREILSVLVDSGTPMSVRDVVDTGTLDARQATLQLSVARVAGFVRAVPGTSGDEPLYAPTSLGFALARRTRAFADAER